MESSSIEHLEESLPFEGNLYIGLINVFSIIYSTVFLFIIWEITFMILINMQSYLLKFQ